MIKNLNSVRNIMKDIESSYEEYRENDVAFMGVAMDSKTNETTSAYIGDTMDFFYMIGSICVSFYEQANIKEIFSPKEFIDYIGEGLTKLFEVINGKKEN